uniref:TnpV protein n=1 Tax=[Eubacterium] hominis TaxID=2764325 RepID=UPI003F8FA565
YFDHEDFMAIFDFNTPSTIGALGTAVSQINQQVLRQIGVTVRNAEREANQERSKQDEQSHDLYPERRLSDSRPEAEPAVHLLEIDETAQSRLEQMMPQLAKEAGATEELKASDPMKWVGLMNTCKAQAEEILMAELINS